MAKIRLDLSQFKASGIYTVEFDASETIVLNTQTTRLVVGFSKKGPINAHVFCPDVKTARRIFGDIDKDLENKGSFFHRSLLTCLEIGPCFALNLVALNNDISTSNADYDTYMSFSLSTTELNGTIEAPLYSSYFNKERFYFPDASYFLANVNLSTSPNIGKLFNFTNLGQSPYSIIVKKTGDLPGFNVTARDWFGAGNVPSFVREFDFISDYFVNIDIVAGNWTDYATLSTDPVYSQYFDSKGIIKSQLSNFLNSSLITRLGSFQGSVIPDLVDSNGVNYSLDTIVNAGIATTGLFCALDRNALNDYDPTDTTSPGRVDMIGHTLIQGTSQVVDFLSYNFTSIEYLDYTPQLPHSVLNNTYLFDFGTGATGNLPAGLGSTGASYSAPANGFNLNLPTGAAYYTSFYSLGNTGKFNNVINIRKEALSSTQYAALSTLTAGASIALEGTGLTQFGTISTVNQTLVGSDIRLNLGISHPDKQFEGTTVGKNAPVIAAVGGTAAYIVVGGTGAAVDINQGDWIFCENTGVRYYFRVSLPVAATGSNTQIFVDVANPEFGGATNIPNITTFFTTYWESIAGIAGSLFDVLDTYTPEVQLEVIANPDITEYTSIVGQSYYTGYEYSPLYIAFNSGILSDGDKA